MSTTDDPVRLVVEDPDDDPVIDPRLADPPADPPKVKTAEELQAELDEANRKAGQYAAERDIALQGLNRPVVPVAANQPPPEDNTAARQKYEAYLEGIGQKQVMGDYKGATQDILTLVDSIVTERVKQGTVPIVSGGARQAVRNFKSTMRDDSLFPKVQDTFDGLIEQALPGIAQMQPEQQDTAIEAVYNIALGQAARKGALNGRREDPPPYATGAPSSGARPSTTQKKLTAMQRQYIISATEAGIPKERQSIVLDAMERGE